MELLPKNVSVSLCSNVIGGIDVFTDIPRELHGKTMTVSIDGFDFIPEKNGNYKTKNFTVNYKTKCSPFLGCILEPVFKKILRSNHNYFCNHCYLESFEFDEDTMTAYMYFGS